MTSHYTRVAGVTFNNRQRVIERCYKGQRVTLHPEPDNPYDTNAVAVFAVFVDLLFEIEEQIGYLPAALAAELAPCFPPAASGVIDRISNHWVRDNGEPPPLGVTIVFALDFPE
jgi:hypothetical protein